MKKWSLGFGLENLGLLALRFPKAATVFMLLTILVSVLAIPRIGFDGNVVNVLDTKSRAFQGFLRQVENFHSFSGDVVVIIEHDDLVKRETFESLRNLHLDLSLEEGIEEVFSLFTLGDASFGNDDSAGLIPPSFSDDEHVATTLKRLLGEEPATGSLISLEERAILMMVRIEPDSHKSESALNKALEHLRETVINLAPENSRISLSGMPHIRSSIVNAIIQDQTVLTSMGILLGSVVAWLIFGNIRSALLCTVPAFLSVVWIIALFAGTGVKLNFFTTALPVLALIIAFADTIVLYFRWQNLSDGAESLESLNKAIAEVGPASSLTSITTAIAFGSFAWADSLTMDVLALFGVASVSLAFLAVIIGLPLACYWWLQFRKPSKIKKTARFKLASEKIGLIATQSPVLFVAAALGMVTCFTWAHFQLKPSYAISEYLPYNSEIRASEAFADKVFGGTSRYYVLMDVSENGSFDDDVHRHRLIDLHNVVAEKFGDKQTQSLASAWKRIGSEDVAKVASGLDDAPPSIVGRYISQDRRIVQVSASVSAGENTLDAERRVGALRQQIDTLPNAEDITITGLSVLLSLEFPKLIEDLRSGLIISIFLAVIVLAVATRNLALAFASLLPNLMPILFTESVMWASGASLSVTNVIGLTIAFGIAIDNAVHVINAYEGLDDVYENANERVRAAVTQIAPALFASTGIVCAASVITQFSSMPSVSELGLLLIATLIVALISNLAILPSSMIVMLNLKEKFFGKVNRRREST